MEQNEFLKIIKTYRRRLNMAGFLKILLFSLCIGAGAGIVLQAAAFIIPIYYANLYAIGALILAVLAAAAGAFVKRINMEQAALAMDRFGFSERIVTAYENLAREGDLIMLQREDAMRELRAHQDRIRIALMPPFRQILLLLGMLALVTGLAFVPSVTKERASEQHSVKKEAKEKTQELEELVETLEELAQEEALTLEQQAQLQEMIESLESSLSEYQQAVSSQQLAAASQKLDYKYQNMADQMSSLAQSLQNGASVSVASLEAMQEMAEQLQKMSGQQLAQNGQNGSGQNSQGGQGNGQNGNGQNGNGQNGNGQNSQNGQNGQNGNGGQGQNGQGGQGNGQGSDGQGGQGNGNGDGNGGNGRGTGSSDNAHDYVSVPNAIADSENLTGNAGNHDDSDFFRAQNGLSWEGEHISHEAVIGSYEQNAYEGISAGKYPSGMEEIIKEYFASFNSP